LDADLRVKFQRRLTVVKLIQAALAKYPRPAAPVYSLPILSLVVIGRDVATNEFETVIPTQIPQEFTETARRLSSRLAPTEPCERPLQF